MTKKIKIFDIQVDEDLVNFINNEILLDLKINKNDYWEGFSKLINKFSSINKKLLNKRISLQKMLNDWHRKRVGEEINKKEYEKFLYEINYIVEEGSEFKINTTNVDPEIAKICGPQLVVPITNARYALNAVNARWGSLYNAVYGTNVLGDLPISDSYDLARGNKVIQYTRSYLDKAVPLVNELWANIKKFELQNKQHHSHQSNHQLLVE